MFASRVGISNQDKDSRVPSSQLWNNSLTFPDFSMQLFPDFPWLQHIYFILKWRAQRGKKSWRTSGLRKKCIWIRVGIWSAQSEQNSLTFLDSQQNSLTFQKKNIFPDFPWCWEPWDAFFHLYLKVRWLVSGDLPSHKKSSEVKEWSTLVWFKHIFKQLFPPKAHRFYLTSTSYP